MQKRKRQKQQRASVSLLAIVVTISGWLTAVFLGLLDLPRKINTFMDEAPTAIDNIANWRYLDENFTGTWTSNIEGRVDADASDRQLAELDGGPVTIKIRVYGNEMHGEIVSGGLKQHYIFSRLMLQGNKQSGQIKGVVFDYVGGKKIAFAKFQVEHRSSKGEEVLHLKTIEQPNAYLPREAKLYRGREAMPDNLGELNTDLMRSISKIRQNEKSDERN